MKKNVLLLVKVAALRGQVRSPQGVERSDPRVE